MLAPGLDGSYHPESDGTLMGAAMSVAKNVASSSTSSMTIPGAAAASKASSTAAKAPPATAGKAAGGEGNGTSTATNGGMTTAGRGVTALQVGADGELSEHPEVTLPGQGKTPVKSEAPAPRKSSFLLNPGGGANQRQSPERKSVTDRRLPGAGGQAATDRRASGAGGGPSVRGGSPANAPDVALGAVGGQGSPDVSLAEKQRARKKSSKCDGVLFRVCVLALMASRGKPEHFLLLCYSSVVPCDALFYCSRRRGARTGRSWMGGLPGKVVVSVSAIEVLARGGFPFTFLLVLGLMQNVEVKVNEHRHFAFYRSTAINIMMSDGVVSIGDGKTGGEASPTSRRRSANLAATNASVAPVAASRVKRSPQGSVAGESSTKGSERDEMEEVSNEEGR